MQLAMTIAQGIFRSMQKTSVPAEIFSVVGFDNAVLLSALKVVVTLYVREHLVTHCGTSMQVCCGWHWSISKLCVKI
jgi:hypothetical protein